MTTAAGAFGGPGTFGEALEQQRLQAEITFRRWQLAKQAVWLTLLTVSFLIFYLLGILQESMALLMVRY